MEISQYQELSKRTLNPDGDFENNIFGLIGESGEIVDKLKKIVYHKHPFDEKQNHQLREEFGDMMWYLAAFASCYEFKLDDIFDSPFKSHEIIMKSCNMTKEQELKYLCYQLDIAVSDISKQYVTTMIMENTEFDVNELKKNLSTVTKYIRLFCKYFDYDIKDIMEDNITKLKMRYKGRGFSTEESINREDTED